MNAPSRLRSANRWIVWRFVQKPGKPKPDKVPYSVKGYQVDRHDSSEWLTFDEALAARGRFDGIGFVLGDGFVGYDHDDCVVNGVIVPDVGNIVHDLKSYTEFSPSGNGVHVIVCGSLPPTGRRTNGHELYDDQFFTFTGNHVAGTPTDVMDRTDEVRMLHRRLFGDRRSTASLTDVPTYIREGRRGTENITDDDIIQRMPNDVVLRLAMGATNGAKFQCLFNGQWGGLFDSQSEADMALCCMLAFWTACNRTQMNELFRLSGLYREKWGEQRKGTKTYGDITIERAIKATHEIYVPLPVADMSTVIDDIGAPTW